MRRIVKGESLKDSNDWLRWGPDDEVGRLNVVDGEVRLAAFQVPTEGEVWPLGQPVFGEFELPSPPERPKPIYARYRDWSYFASGRLAETVGGGASVDDGFFMNCHGGSHVDALGHVIYDGIMWGGRSADATVGGRQHADISAVARRGVITRAVLIDLVALRGAGPLPRNAAIRLPELQACLAAEGVEVRKGDMLLLRTGSLERYRQEGSEQFFHEYSEPGVVPDDALLEWIDSVQLLGLGTDTLANELPVNPETGEEYVLHRRLLRDRGMPFHEALWLADLAASCAADKRYVGLYVVSPLMLVGASASPINPLFIK
jgi:kynurenine formamidase